MQELKLKKGTTIKTEVSNIKLILNKLNASEIKVEKLVYGTVHSQSRVIAKINFKEYFFRVSGGGVPITWNTTSLNQNYSGGKIKWSTCEDLEEHILPYTY